MKEQNCKANLWSSYIQGDNNALSKLYLLVFEPLLLKAFYLTKDHEEAKDIVADLFSYFMELSIEKRAKKWKDIRDVEAFLYGCVKKKSLAFLRKKQVRAKLINHVHFMYERVDESKVSLTQFVDDSIKSLSKNEQNLFRLHFNGYSNHEIADLMNLSEKTVRNKLSISRLKLSKIWKNWSVIFILICNGMV